MRRKAEVPILLTELTQRSERFDRQVTYSGALILARRCSTAKAKLFSPWVISAKKEALSIRLRRSNLSPMTRPRQ